MILRVDHKTRCYVELVNLGASPCPTSPRSPRRPPTRSRSRPKDLFLVRLRQVVETALLRRQPQGHVLHPGEMDRGRDEEGLVLRLQAIGQPAALRRRAQGFVTGRILTGPTRGFPSENPARPSPLRPCGLPYRHAQRHPRPLQPHLPGLPVRDRRLPPPRAGRGLPIRFDTLDRAEDWGLTPTTPPAGYTSGTKAGSFRAWPPSARSGPRCRAGAGWRG